MGTRQATMVMPTLTVSQHDLIYNMTSLGLASMAASTVFFFLRLPSFKEEYRAALCFTGLVTFIACYHYFRIFDSFNAAYTPCKVTDGTVDYNTCSAETFGYSATGIAFNDAYRYVDWLLTVPLLLIEIILVMRLPEAETFERCWKLGLFSGLMIANGYPGETSGDASTRWFFWMASMCPFMYILPMMTGSETGKAGLSAQAITAVQTGYTISDIISKCGVGFLVYRIGLAKSNAGEMEA